MTSAVIGGVVPIIVSDDASAYVLSGGVLLQASAVPLRRSALFRQALVGGLLGGAAAPAVVGPMPNAPTQLIVTDGAGQFIVDWTAPLTNADGSALSALLNYKVYWGATAGQQHAGGTYTDVASVAAGTLTKTVAGLAAGTWWTSVSAVNANGESSPGGEASGAVT